MSMIRLDKYLADMGIGTRSEVKNYIRKGRVTVNDRVITAAETKIDAGKDRVVFDGTPVGYVEMEYYLLNKPAGVISATQDPHQKTVLDLIETKNRKDLFPVGRLDKDTEGLLLITNDGDLAHQLLSPRKHVDKVYYVELDGEVPKNLIHEFEEGVLLSDGVKTRPAKLVIHPRREGHSPSCELTIHEGKFHQVKRMFEAFGLTVTYLKRLSMGPLKLDEDLNIGDYRSLREEEIAELKNHIQLNSMLDGISAVIFDMDGTLIDSMLIWKSIDVEFLGQRNIPMPEDLQKNIEGMSFVETAQWFKRTFQLPESLEEIQDIWNAMAFKRYAHGMKMKDGAGEFIRKLYEKGILMGIATSNSRPLVEACLKDLGILEYFGAIVTGCEITNGKPQPDIYLKAAEKLNVSPENCLVFEDIPMGIMAGKNAGMRTCAVWDLYSEPMAEEKRKLADYWIDRYQDIRI